MKRHARAHAVVESLVVRVGLSAIVVLVTGTSCGAGDSDSAPDERLREVEQALCSPADCTDNNSCTDDACVNGACSNAPRPNQPCSDGNPCTTGDTCDPTGG